MRTRNHIRIYSGLSFTVVLTLFLALLERAVTSFVWFYLVMLEHALFILAIETRCFLLLRVVGAVRGFIILATLFLLLFFRLFCCIRPLLLDLFGVFRSLTAKSQYEPNLG